MMAAQAKISIEMVELTTNCANTPRRKTSNATDQTLCCEYCGHDFSIPIKSRHLQVESFNKHKKKAHNLLGKMYITLRKVGQVLNQMEQECMKKIIKYNEGIKVYQVFRSVGLKA